MKNITRKILTTAIAGLVFAGASAVFAGQPNPVNGYTSVFYSIENSGPNSGRCHALGNLAAMVCAEDPSPLTDPDGLLAGSLDTAIEKCYGIVDLFPLNESDPLWFCTGIRSCFDFKDTQC